jgi:membrane protease YdiL (CAAX protease family)
MRILENPVVRIVTAILWCLAVPIAVKLLILQPIFGLMDLDEDTSKGFQAVIVGGVILAAYQIYYKRVERRQVPELSRVHLFKEAVSGFGMGFVIVAIVAGILYLFGYYSPVAVNPVVVLIKPGIIFFVMGVWEEVIFRGIIYRVTEKYLGTIKALLISASIFGFIHFTNSGFNWFSGLAIALELGLLTGLTYTLSGRLWMPIALHIGWNFSFVFFGMTVSGAQEFSNFIESRLTGPVFITGGEFGPENSLITILISWAFFAVLYKLAAQRGKIKTQSRERKNNV